MSLVVVETSLQTSVKECVAIKVQMKFEVGDRVQCFANHGLVRQVFSTLILVYFSQENRITFYPLEWVYLIEKRDSKDHTGEFG